MGSDPKNNPAAIHAALSRCRVSFVVCELSRLCSAPWRLPALVAASPSAALPLFEATQTRRSGTCHGVPTAPRLPRALPTRPSAYGYTLAASLPHPLPHPTSPLARLYPTLPHPTPPYPTLPHPATPCHTLPHPYPAPALTIPHRTPPDTHPRRVAVPGHLRGWAPAHYTLARVVTLRLHARELFL